MPRKSYKTLYEEKQDEYWRIHHQLLDTMDELEGYKKFIRRISNIFGEQIIHHLTQVTDGDLSQNTVIAIHPVIRDLYGLYLGNPINGDGRFIAYSFNERPIYTSNKQHVSLRFAADAVDVEDIPLCTERKQKLHFMLKELGLVEDD